MRRLASLLLLLAASLAACQDDPPATDVEEVAALNDESEGPVFDFPDGSSMNVGLNVFFSSEEECELELRADAFTFDLISGPEGEEDRMIVHAVAVDDDLAALVECAGLIDPDEGRGP
jgi:hypothetical protein